MIVHKNIINFDDGPKNPFFYDGLEDTNFYVRFSLVWETDGIFELFFRYLNENEYYGI